MMNLSKPYHWPLNYLEYVKDFHPYAHVKVFKVAIKVNGETNDANIVNFFSFTFKKLCLTSIIITWELPRLY